MPHSSLFCTNMAPWRAPNKRISPINHLRTFNMPVIETQIFLYFYWIYGVNWFIFYYRFTWASSDFIYEHVPHLYPKGCSVLIVAFWKLKIFIKPIKQNVSKITLAIIWTIYLFKYIMAHTDLRDLSLSSCFWKVLFLYIFLYFNRAMMRMINYRLLNF